MSRIGSKSPKSLSAKAERQGWRSQAYSFWKFSRPHTIVGTSLSVIGIYLIAIAQSIPFQPLGLAITWLACLCGNVYIVGLNQLEDIAIDKINKPHLPLAAGEFSRRQATVIVTLTGIAALILAAIGSLKLLAMVGLSLLIGTAYSMPPVRLKRFPLLAAFCIFTVRGVIVNLGLFFHFVQQWTVPPLMWALTLFIVGFTAAIALYKDIPDVEGDQQYRIRTFTLQLGRQRVFQIAVALIVACYVGMAITALLGLPGVNPTFLIVSHLLAALLLLWRTHKVDLHSRADVAKSYQFIWKLFFLEYLLFPIACLLQRS